MLAKEFISGIQKIIDDSYPDLKADVCMDRGQLIAVGLIDMNFAIDWQEWENINETEKKDLVKSRIIDSLNCIANCVEDKEITDAKT